MTGIGQEEQQAEGVHLRGQTDTYTHNRGNFTLQARELDRCTHEETCMNGRTRRALTSAC